VKKIITILVLFCIFDLFAKQNFLENRKNHYIDNILKKENNIITLYDVIQLSEISNYFDDNPIKKTLNKIKTSDNLLNTYLDLYKYNSNDDTQKNKIGYINNYYVIGPFNNQGKSGFLKSYLPETLFSKEKTYDGKNQELLWKTISNYENSFINFKNFLNPKVDSLGYLLAFVDIKKNGVYQVKFGTNNQYELFIDKKSILKSDDNSFLYYDTNTIKISLNKGIHTILIKLDNKYKTWGVYLRVLNKIGKFDSNNIQFVLKDNYPDKFPKSKILSLDNPLIKKLNDIKNKDYEYYLKRGIIEKYFTLYDKSTKPYPYEQYLKKAIKLAKNDLEKGEAYYQSYINSSNKEEISDFLDKSIEYSYFPAILEKIKNDIDTNKIYEINKLIEKAKKIDRYDYRLLMLINRYYILLGADYLNRIINEYQKSLRISKFFEFKIDKMKFTNTNKSIKVYEHSKDETFFTIEDTKNLLSLYLQDLDFEKYEELLKDNLNKNHLSFDYNSMMITFLFSQKRYSDLINLFEEKKELLYDSPRIIKTMAKAYQLNGDSKNSIKYYNKYLTLNPNDTSVKEYLAFIKTNKKELWAEKYIQELEKNDIKYKNYKSNNVPIEEIYEHTIIKVNSDYSFNLYKKRALAINNSESVKKFKYLPIYYLPNNESVNNSSLRIIKKDGETEEISNYKDKYYRSKSNGAFSNYSIRFYYIHNLEKGDIIELSYYLKNNNTYEDPFFASFYNLNSSYPSKRKTFTFLTDNKELDFNLKPQIKEKNKYFFEFSNLKEIKNEPSSTGYASNYKFLSVSSLKSWQEVIDWYKELLFKQNLLSKKTKDEIHKGVDKIVKLEDKIKWIQKYLFEHTHYIGIELGLNAYKPFSAIEVLERKYGDCKDKANLFNALLNEIGIESEIVLLRTNNLGQIRSELPANPRYFNHAISYIPKLDLFVDLTADKNGLFDLPFSDQEATGIIIRNNEKLKQLPLIESKEIIDINGIKNNNNLEAKITLKLENSLGSSFRYGLENKELRKDYLQKILKPIFNSLEIKNFEIKNFEDINKNLIITINILVKDFFNNNKMYNSIFIKKLLENEGLLNQRTEEYKKLKISIEENINIEGVNINNKNNTFKLDNKDVSYLSIINIGKNKNLTVKNKISWKSYSIDVKSYPKFRNSISEITNIIKNNIIFLVGDK
jgi:hypothetical protein